MSSSRMLERIRNIPARVWLALALLVIALVFILQNRASTNIGFFTLTISAPLWTVLVVSVAVGALIGALLRWRRKPPNPTTSQTGSARP